MVIALIFISYMIVIAIANIDLIKEFIKDSSLLQNYLTTDSAVVERINNFKQKAEDEGANCGKALKWYKKAAGIGRGDADAQYKIGNIYYDGGNGVKQDKKKAAAWYKKASIDIGRSHGGHREAKCKLGDMYYLGDGVKKDIERALFWYKKAAKSGDKEAQYKLGNMYYYGEGVEKNINEALKWYKNSSEQGFADAQCALGNIYRYGDGVEEDINEAVRWYKAAARQGRKEAKEKIIEADSEAAKWHKDDGKEHNWLKRIYVSTALPSKNERYSSKNLFDNNVDTVWASDGDGVGAVIEIETCSPCLALGILNGFVRNEKLYYENSRIKKMRVEYADNNGVANILTTEEIEFEDIPYERVDNKSPRETAEKIWFSAKRKDSLLARLTILEVYPGTKYKDLCISEIYCLNSGDTSARYELSEKPFFKLYNR